jgi:hypothetical protein
LHLLEQKGKSLLKCIFPESIDIEMSHIVLDTNMNIPFELLCNGQMFALKYSIGRKLRVTGSIQEVMRREIKLKINRRAEKIRALLIADPESTLEGAVQECNLISEELSKVIDVDYIKQEEATFAHVIDLLLRGYTIIHYAGHLTETGFPFAYKTLSADMVKLFLNGSPIVFINGCKSAGTVHTGLAQAFLQGGALGYIGTPFDIHDKAAADIAISFYKHCLDHYSIGEAMRIAKEKAYQENNIAWTCFMLFGDPTLLLI